MSNIVTSQQIYPALKALLGLPDLCVSFEMRASYDGAVMVSCEHYLSLDSAGIGQLTAALSEFELVRRAQSASTHPAEAMGFDAWMRERTDAAHRTFMLRTAATSAGAGSAKAT